MIKIKHLLTVLFLTFLSTFSMGQQIEMIPLPPQQASFTFSTRGFHFTSPLDMKIISLRVPTTISTGPQSIAVVSFNNNQPPPAFPGTTSNYTELFYVSNDPSMTEIPVDIDLTAGQVYGVYGSRNGANSYGTIGPWMTQVFGEDITLSRSGMQTNIANNFPFPIWSEVNFRIGRIEVTCQLGGGGGGVLCEPNDCVVVTCPDDVTVTCYEDYELDAENATAEFTCGGTEAFRYVTEPHITGAANCPGTTYEVVYKVGDNQGNVGCCVQTITVENAPPTIEVIPGEVVSCYEDIVTLDEDATVVSTCGEAFDLKILPPELDGVHQCPGTTYTYTYRVRDNCGREVTAARIFTIGDNAPPSIVSPPDMTVSCDFNANLNPEYAEVTTGCTLGYTTTVTGPTTSGAANCPGSTYTYTYTVTDDCGRTASDVRTFTIANDAPTFLNCPAVPLQLNCEDEGWENIIQAWLASVQAESACGDALNVSNNYNPNTQGLCINNGTRVVRFFATDACGRTSSCEGMVIVADTEAPTFVTAPQDELVVCNYITQDKLDAWVDAHGGAEVEDCWDNVSWSTFPNNPTINCSGNMAPTSLTVEFVATDGCGNKSSMEATFTALPAMSGSGNDAEDVAATEKLQLFQNQPNPFSDETAISFYMPASGKATLSIFDINGKLLKVIRGDYAQGTNVETINRSDLAGAGMLYYQISTATETATRRMILLD